ncbi:hypothetical protein K4L44_09405 [Halosquirtibacter laminarini]|uniref:Uncharacterized protein n=1 Tax=Halosquirtibacter laminarini TaxID=3374600 RepID=A0AC61NQS7_9BACT|nr:hypothetical protein K4L44_09405 [Prolixibacteraceae bacterium]
MNIDRRILLFFLLFVGPISTSWSFEYLPVVKSFSKDQYRAGRQNWATTVDNQGTVFFGNSNGLLRNIYGQWHLNKTSKDDEIRCLAIDQDTIWCGGLKQFGYFSKKDAKDLVYTELSGNSQGAIWNVLSTPNLVYFQSDSRIAIYDKQSRHLSYVDTPNGYSSIAFFRDKVWATSKKGDLGVVSKNAFIPKYHIPNHTEVRELFIHHDKIYILFFDGSIYTLNKQRMDKVVFPKQMQNKSFFSAISLDNSTIALGSISHGLFVYDTQHGKIIRHISNKDGLLDDTILSMAKDSHGTLWLGLDYGISNMVLESPIREVFNQGAAYDILLQDRTMFVASNKGLFVLSDDKKSFVEGSDGQSWRVCDFNNHTFLCHNNGLFTYSKKQGLKALFSEDGIMDMAPLSRSDHYLLTGYTGVYHVKISHEKLQVIERLPIHGNPKLYYDSDHQLVWVDSKYSSLNSCKLNKDGTIQVKKYPDIKTFFHTEEGLFFYNGHKLFDYVHGLFVPSKQHGVKQIDGIRLTELAISDDFEDIIYVQEGQIVVLKLLPDGTYYRNNKLLSHMENKLIVGDERIVIRGRKAYFTTERGVMVYLLDYKNMVVSDNKPQIITISYKTSDESTVVWYPPFDYDKIIFPKNTKTITISYGMSKRWFDVVEYSTMLTPFQEKYEVRSSESHSQTFTNLQGGSYRFVVKSVVNGAMSSSFAFSFEVEKHWYETLWVLIPILLTLSLLLFIIWKVVATRTRNKLELFHQQEAEKRAAEELKTKNNQLLQYMEVVSNKNQFLNKIKDGLARMRNSEAQRWIRRIDDEVNNEKKNYFYFSLFSEIHQDFINHVRVHFPDLTSYDIRLISFIRMNMSTHDIASLLNISDKSVETARYRLRKKMKLEKEVDLNLFVQNF